MAEGLDDALALAARLPWPAVSAGGSLCRPRPPPTP